MYHRVSDSQLLHIVKDDKERSWGVLEEIINKNGNSDPVYFPEVGLNVSEFN